MKTVPMSVAAVAAFLLFAAPGLCGAADGELGLPGAPWVVVQFAGTRELSEAWAGTALGRMMADPEIEPALREGRAALEGLLLAKADEALDREKAEAMFDSLGELFASPWMLGIYAPSGPGESPPVALTARMGDRSAALQERLRDVLGEIGGADAVEEIQLEGAKAFRMRAGEGLSAFAAAGDRLVGASSPELLSAVMAAEGLPANAAGTFSRLKTGVPAARFYIDLGAILDTIGEQEPEAAGVFDAFALSELGSVAVEIGFDGELVRGAGRVAFRGEGPWRLAELVRAEPLTDEDLAAIPPNAFSFSVARVDLARFWDYLMEGIASLNPEAIDQINAGLAGLKEQIGIDVEQDIVRTLGTRVSTYSTPGAGMMPGMGNMSMVWTLRDSERFRTALDRAMTLAAQMIDAQQAQQQETPIRFKLQSSEGEGVQVWYLAGLPMAAPALGVGQDALAFSLQPNACRAELLRLESSTSSILSNADFAAVWPGIRGTAQSVSYEDLRSTVPGLYQAAMTFAPMLAASKGVNLDLAWLPTVDAISRYLGPVFAWDGVDEDGMYFGWTSPIGIAGGGSPTNPAVIGIVAGMALPAVAKARDQARSVACASNLKQVGLGLMMYATDNEEDRLPSKLEGLVPAYISNDALMSCPSGGGYLYLAPLVRLGDIASPAEAVLAMDDAPRHRSGRNALFADAHVEWIPEARAQEVLARVGEITGPTGD